MNRLYIGLWKEVELPDGFLFIDDEIPNIPEWKRPKIFDPLKHGFNPLKDIGLLLIAQFKGQWWSRASGSTGGMPTSIWSKKTGSSQGWTRSESYLLVPEKMASGAIADDAEELAKYQGLLKGTNAFNDFVEKAIA
jgi:hypothetical protein